MEQNKIRQLVEGAERAEKEIVVLEEKLKKLRPKDDGEMEQLVLENAKLKYRINIMKRVRIRFLLLLALFCCL